MSMNGDAAEKIVKLSLEGFEVAARLTGKAAEEIAALLVSVLKQEKKTSGKTRLTSMIRSGKELKVFTVRNKDLPMFVRQARRYGVLYCVLRDRNQKGDDMMVDIIARSEDAPKITRIFEKFRLEPTEDKVSVVTDGKERSEPERTEGERMAQEAVKQDTSEIKNPSPARTDKDPLSGRNSVSGAPISDKGLFQDEYRPSVREKLERYIEADRLRREAEYKMPVKTKTKGKGRGR